MNKPLPEDPMMRDLIKMARRHQMTRRTALAGASATAAALGVLTPMPCIPATATPWIPGGAPTLLLGGMPAIDANSTLMCNWAGVIKIVMPGQMQMLIP